MDIKSMLACNFISWVYILLPQHHYIKQRKGDSHVQGRVETVLPYREAISLEVEKKGFGRYEIAMQMADLSQPPIHIGGPNVWVEMNWGNYGNLKDIDSVMTVNIGRFGCTYENQEEMINKIEELPESANIFLSVSDAHSKSIEQLRSLSVKLLWLQVYQPDVEFQGGLSTEPVAVYSDDDMREGMTEQELLEVYCRNLENIIENPEVWEGIGVINNGNGKVYTNPKPLLKDTYEDAKKITELKSENYCVYGNRDEILKFLQENELDSIYVENVVLW
ncbi:MAG: hypothetical protein PUB22_10660 [Clostridiales bacterium]|nr:hypothetical protein [Clostridiales bacterium]